MKKTIYISGRRKGLYDLPIFDIGKISSDEILNEIERGFESEKY